MKEALHAYNYLSSYVLGETICCSTPVNPYKPPLPLPPSHKHQAHTTIVNTVNSQSIIIWSPQSGGLRVSLELRTFLLCFPCSRVLMKTYTNSVWWPSVFWSNKTCFPLPFSGWFYRKQALKKHKQCRIVLSLSVLVSFHLFSFPPSSYSFSTISIKYFVPLIA